MADSVPGGTLRLADDLVISRMGFGAMQLAGPGVFGPPRDRDQALAVLREAVDLGVTHIDTSDFYGPFVVNELIREALHPYPADLRIVTKVGARRGQDGSWRTSLEPDDLKAAVRENLAHLGVDVLDVVNLRLSAHGTGEESVAEPFGALAEMQKEGLIRHLGLSEATDAQLTEAQAIAPVVTVQNLYNLAEPARRRHGRPVRGRGHRLRRVLPARRLHPAPVGDAERRRRAAGRLGAAGRPGLAAAAVARDGPHPRDLVGGPPAREHRRGGPGPAAGRDRGPRRHRPLARPQPQPRAASVNAPLTAATMAGMASSPSGWDGFSASTVTT